MSTLLAKEWTEEDTLHMDVRGIPAPGPLVAILRRVRELARGERLIVHHDRDPKLLYVELADMGWEAVPQAAPAGEVRLLLREIP